MIPDAVANVAANVAGSLSGLINLVPAIGKLTILPIKEIGPIPIPVGLPYVVMFNPENYTVSENFEYNSRQGLGRQSAQQKFVRQNEPQFSFEFTIDGTGASGEKKEVLDEIKDFKSTVGFNGTLHKPNTVLLVWGELIKICVLKQMTIKYTLMRSDGTPLRAVISPTFVGHTKTLAGVLIENLLSPDLSHRRMVKDEDKLPLMCFNIYEKPHFYLQVAQANGLTNFRRLKPGTTLDFPPVDK